MHFVTHERPEGEEEASAGIPEEFARQMSLLDTSGTPSCAAVVAQRRRCAAEARSCIEKPHE